MVSDRTKMRDGDMPLLNRIDVALRRVTSGQGQMRIPAEATDPDLVLLDCKEWIAALERAISDALPGVAYMDPPDGGSVSLAEQLRRIAADAARYRWLRDEARHKWYGDELLAATGGDLTRAVDASVRKEGDDAQ